MKYWVMLFRFPRNAHSIPFEFDSPGAKRRVARDVSAVGRHNERTNTNFSQLAKKSKRVKEQGVAWHGGRVCKPTCNEELDRHLENFPPRQKKAPYLTDPVVQFTHILFSLASPPAPRLRPIQLREVSVTNDGGEYGNHVSGERKAETD